MTALENKFATLADSIGLRHEGLPGATIYRDSQLEIASRSLSPEERRVAAKAFNHAFERRIARQWPDHPRAELARPRLQTWTVCDE